MPGGLIQLAAYSNENIYINSNPEISFFKYVYKRHTNFTIESIGIDSENTAKLNSKFSFIVPRSGDLINKCYLETTLPALPYKLHYHKTSYREIRNRRVDLIEQFTGEEDIEDRRNKDAMLLSTSNFIIDLYITYDNVIWNTNFELNIDIPDNIYFTHTDSWVWNGATDVEYFIKINEKLTITNISSKIFKYQIYTLEFVTIIFIHDSINAPTGDAATASNNWDGSTVDSFAIENGVVTAIGTIQNDSQNVEHAIIVGLKDLTDNMNDNAAIVRQRIRTALEGRYDIIYWMNYDLGINIRLPFVKDDSNFISDGTDSYDLDDIISTEGYNKSPIILSTTGGSARVGNKYISPDDPGWALLHKIIFPTGINLWDGINPSEYINVVFEDYHNIVLLIHPKNSTRRLFIFRTDKDYTETNTQMINTIGSDDNGITKPYIIGIKHLKGLTGMSLYNQMAVETYNAIVKYKNTSVYPYFIPQIPTFNPTYIKNVGEFLIKSVSIKVGEQTIDKHYGDWLNIWNDLTLTESQKINYNKMIGNVNELNNPYNDIILSTTTRKIYIPLQFWFCRNLSLSLPLISLQYSQVKFDFELRSIDEITTGELDKSTDINLSNTKLFVDYVYLDKNERRNIAQNTQEYLIEQLQFTGSEILFKNYQNFNLKFNHPIKEIIWTIKISYDKLAFYYDNSISKIVQRIDTIISTNPASYDLGNYGNLHLHREHSEQKNILNKSHLQFDGLNRFSERSGNYFNWVQPYQHHNNSLRVGIYVYSFSLNPEKLQPTGTCNFSRIDNCILKINVFFNS